MVYQDLALYIDGEFVKGGDRREQDVINPATQELLGKLPHATTADLDRALAAAQGVQIVGALLVMSLLITPAAAAARVCSSPVKAMIASVVFAETAAVGGLVLSLAPGVPVSVFVTTISFAIFLICWLIGSRR